MLKDGEDWHGLQTTNLKSLTTLFEPFNHDCAPLISSQDSFTVWEHQYAWPP